MWFNQRKHLWYPLTHLHLTQSVNYSYVNITINTWVQDFFKFSFFLKKVENQSFFSDENFCHFSQFWTPPLWNSYICHTSPRFIYMYMSFQCLSGKGQNGKTENYILATDVKILNFTKNFRQETISIKIKSLTLIVHNPSIV